MHVKKAASAIEVSLYQILYLLVYIKWNCEEMKMRLKFKQKATKELFTIKHILQYLWVYVYEFKGLNCG